MKNRYFRLAPALRLAAAAVLLSSLAAPVLASPTAPRMGGALLTSVSGRISAVDSASRTVTLQNAHGEQMDIVVGPEVRNFKLIKPGDTITLDYYESIAVDVRPAGSGAPEIVSDIAGVRSHKNALPGGAIGRQTTITAKIWHINERANLVTLQGPEGKRRTIQFQDPAMRAKLQAVHEGDLVDFTITQAIAAAVHRE